MPASQVLLVKKEVEVPEEDEEGLVTRVRKVHKALWVLLADMVNKELLESKSPGIKGEKGQKGKVFKEKNF